MHLTRSKTTKLARLKRPAISLVLLFLLIFPAFSDSATSALTLNQMGIAVILAISYNLLLGKAGLLSLGHAAYFGFGGFFSVHVINAVSGSEGWITAPLVPFFGGLMGFVGALVLGSFTTKRGGLIFAMLSFAMAELVLASSTVFGRFYGGSLDRTEIPSFLGVDFQSDFGVYYIVLFWVVIAIMIAAGFNASPLGRMAEAVGQNSDRVEYVGYDQQRLKFLTFCLSGFLAGIAGGLFALTYEFVTVEIISLKQSWLILQMVFIGGAGFFWGPPVGAVLLTLVFSGLNGVTDIWNLYAGIVFIAVVLFAPYGLTGIARNITIKLSVDPNEDALKAYGIALLGISLTTLGAVGLFEMTYFVKNPNLVSAELFLLWLHIDTTSFWPWSIFGIVLVSGGWIDRQAFKKIAALH